MTFYRFSGSSSVAAPNSSSSYAPSRNVASILGNGGKSSDNKMNNDDSNRKLSNDNR